ncbi:MAG: hypothetical protein JKY56_24205 [Kofleriaceae bacterium]|nr:hypothetical protein [Kofleriaceae bacterium]
MMKQILALSLLISACAAPVAGRFKDQPIVWRVDDSRDIPEPDESIFDAYTYYLDAYVFDRLTDLVDPPEIGPAQDTNALDELPDSSWFQNRIGQREMSPKEAATGANDQGPPQLPITIFAAKTGGANPGFFAKDIRGVRYLIKFDNAENPEQQTAGDVIVSRIFWTLGYFVPSDNVFHFQRNQVIIGEKVKKQLSEKDIDEMLVGAARNKEGAIRSLASQFVPGIPKGGWSGMGTREDDPNDQIDHEQRRALRALLVFSAWLGHTDLKEDNSIDVYVDEDGTKFLKHFLVDFGEALGGHQSEKAQLSIGWEHGFDWQAQGMALVSFGLHVRQWEDQKETPWKSIGHFGSKYFNAPDWRERYYYPPYHFMDDADGFWAAKLVMKFTRPMLEAIVAEGHFTEPAAAAYLVDTLLARAWNVGNRYLDRVTPLDEFTFEDGKLCATDLSRKYGIATYGRVELLDHKGKELSHIDMDADGRVCLPIASDEEYRILRARIRRADGRTPPMEIHYKGGDNARILGIVRN